MACLVELSVAEDISKDQEQKNVRRRLRRAGICQEAKTASAEGIGRAIGRPHFCIVADPILSHQIITVAKGLTICTCSIR